MPNTTDIFSVLEAWEYGAAMDGRMAHAVNDDLDDLMERELPRIEAMIELAPSQALMRVTRLFSFVNAASAWLPAILRRLEQWIQRVQALVNALGKKLGATGYSIGVSTPGGLSFDLSFPVV